MTATGNVDSFRHGFREEARELLVELESVLLELNEHPQDEGLVGRVFRALHTIKGSGAMFGFDALTAFAHKLENAFDEMRKGRLAVTPDLVDLTLSALDQTRAMVDEGEGSTAVDGAACAAILTRLQTLMGPEVQTSVATAANRPSAADSGPEIGPERDWRIRFAPGPDLMHYGADPLLLLRELRGMGRMTASASMDAIPSLEELEPERCYVSWEIRLTTRATEDAIRDVFIFVEDSCDLAIELCAPEPPEERRESPAGSSAAKCEPSASAAPPPYDADRVARSLEEKRRATGRRAGDQPDAATSLRVPAARLDQLVDLVGERVTVQARLRQIAARSGEGEVLAVSEEIERLTSALRENSMTLRMLPIRATFEKFRRLVHDLARDLGKNVELTIEGAETELDKTVIDQLGDPLMHLIRNSMDHGVETPDQRAAQGKKSAATIHLSARHSGASVLIAVTDDGAGIDAEAVLHRAIERGLPLRGSLCRSQCCRHHPDRHGRRRCARHAGDAPGRCDHHRPGRSHLHRLRHAKRGHQAQRSRQSHAPRQHRRRDSHCLPIMMPGFCDPGARCARAPSGAGAGGHRLLAARKDVRPL